MLGGRNRRTKRREVDGGLVGGVGGVYVGGTDGDGNRHGMGMGMGRAICDVAKKRRRSDKKEKTRSSHHKPQRARGTAAHGRGGVPQCHKTPSRTPIISLWGNSR